MTRPKPIGQHPHAGQLAVVVSFRLADLTQPVDLWAKDMVHALRLASEDNGGHVHDLSIAIRVIGAAGEAGDMEGEGP